MKKLLIPVLGWMMVFSFGLAAPSFADENEVVALKNEVSQLNKKIADLETRLTGVQSDVQNIRPSVGTAVPAPSGQTGGGLLHLAEDVNVGGYVEVQWNDNFRQPTALTTNTTGIGAPTASTSEGTNRARVYDTDDNSFTVNSTELYFEKVAQEANQAGFRFDIQMGEDADVNNADGDGTPGGAANDAKFDLQQAYVQYIAPLSFFEGNDILPNSVDIKVGRFVTLAGFEVIEAPNNWNISRSIGYGFGLPIAHTGVRTQFGLFNNKLTTYAGINNGWDDPVDVNSNKTLEFGLGYNVLDNVKVFHSIYYGEEGVPGSGKRFLSSNVVTVDLTDKFSLAGEADLAREGNVDVDGRTADWYDFAVYARYQFNEKFAMVSRSEIFVDDMSFRTSTTAGVPPLGPGSDRTWEQTFTAEYKLTDNLITRAEVRFDKSDDDVLIGSSSSQTTIGGQVIYVI